MAERAAPLLAWAEATEGGALESLRVHGPTILANAEASLERGQLAATHWEFSAPGKSLLQVGPVAIDLLTYSTRTFGSGRVDIRGVVDGLFVSGLLRMAAQRGLCALALGFPGTRFGPRSERCMLVNADRSGPAFFSSDLLPAEIPGDLHSADVSSEKNVETHQLEPAPDLEYSALSLFGLGVPDACAGSDMHGLDLEAKFRTAQSNGVLVDRQDFENLYRLETVTWAPTSERSRKQALI
ncbi:hypothetical protein FHS85_002457 [Rhodoligotrophos appendicifer]|uniref:hypothetical protein n=1 Tax=Rhodoligotrophos appendicifer TaxID=987056 RepID=UPI001187207E|nr:hypothetical protein [Rhodoligotrophos appendicifer]